MLDRNAVAPDGTTFRQSGRRVANRITPKSGPENYQTFSIIRPKQTHTRSATCEESLCEDYMAGWRNRVPVTDTASLEWLRSSACKSRWKYTEYLDGNEVVFSFPAGQTCFKANTHRASLDRPEIYVVKGGDWRGNPRRQAPIVHKAPEHWVENMQEELDKVRRDREG